MKLLFILHSTIMGGATISCLKLVHGLIDNNIVPIIVYPNRNVDKCFLDIVNKYGIKHILFQYILQFICKLKH